MTDRSDQQLIQDIRNSDTFAFEELHRRYWQVLHALAYQRIGDSEETKDLLQELFLEVWEIRASLNFGNAPERWLRNRLWFKIGRYFREKGATEKHRRHFLAFLADQSDQAAAPSESELRDEERYYQEIFDALDRTIQAMPGRMREVFLMSRSENLSVKEIAERLDISPQTVKTQLERAMQRLRKAAEPFHPTALELLYVLWLLNG
ncbi:RNA polymerase sigma factor [Parapedobacter sp. DT-150]|uniref:RNA polymerase sigma factor n=1 Tax=Parapedobacter sp. DT-150 TaxID=3396162 RepID=UPI003F1E1279